MAAGNAAFEQAIDASYLNGTLGGAAIYALSDTWNLIGGVGTIYSNAPELDFGDLVDDPFEVMPVPVLGAQWNQDAEAGLSLSLLFPVEASISYRSVDGTLSVATDLLAQSAALTYQLTPMFGVTASGSLNDGSIHRLADDNVAIPIGTKEGYLQNVGSTVDLMLHVTLFDQMKFTVGPYYRLNQELSVRDKDDDSLHTLEADDALGGKFGVSFIF